MGIVSLDGIDEAKKHPWVIEYTRRPHIELILANIIATYSKLFHATMDVSDGLAFTLHTIATASNISIEINEIPHHPVELDKYCNNNPKCIWDHILYGGEEYGVVLVIDNKYKDLVIENLERYEVPYVIAGKTGEPPPRIVIKDYGEVKPHRWDQFKGWA